MNDIEKRQDEYDKQHDKLILEFRKIPAKDYSLRIGKWLEYKKHCDELGSFYQYIYQSALSKISQGGKIYRRVKDE